MIKPNYEEILKVKTDHYGETKAAHQFAAEEFAGQYKEELEKSLEENKASLRLFNRLKEQDGFTDIGGHVGAAIYRLNEVIE